MTDHLVKEARQYIEKIDELGGMAQAIETGYIQREIQENAYRLQKEVEKEDRVVVGVNQFIEEDEEKNNNLLKVDPAVENEQIEELKNIKVKRDDQEVKDALTQIKKAAVNDNNLMYPIIKAVKAYATIGEISDVLREEFGEYEAQYI